jgi:lipoprotein-anchoring transpeptidase ErfK/SrfK
MKVYKLVVFLFLFLSGVIISEPYWPQLFSKQDEINPETISNVYDEKAEIAFFDNKELKIPNQNNLLANINTKVLGENSSNRRIEVSLTEQRLYAYEGDNLVYSFLVSSGKWDRTPTGTFKIWIKVRSQKMSGGSKELGTYYYLPNVPYVMFFYNDQVAKKVGYSLHGTYWHNNFGTPMSHGCVNMKTSEIAQLYPWAEVDTPVIIYGKYEYKKVELPEII